jgi:hypothetical protein
MTVFFESVGLPVHSMVLLESREEALAVPRGDMALGVCGSCGFISNTAFDPAKVDYFSDYESSQAFSPTFNAFAQQSARDLVERFGLKGKAVTEIGCGAGDFLDLLCESGIGAGTGVDPAPYNKSLADKHRGKLAFIKQPYSPAHFAIKADLLLCRMTLEHVPEVREFISLAHSGAVAAGNCPVVFQVPDAERVFRDVAFWDVYYEHCSYFTRHSLARLFESCGFKVLRICGVYDAQYLWLEALPGGGTARALPTGTGAVKSLIKMVDDYAPRRQAMVETWRERVRSQAARGRKCVIWGGGSKGVAFVNALGISDELDCLVDINLAKQDKFVAGSGHLIVGPEALRQRRPDWILVMNPVYLAEIRDTVRKMGLRSEVTSL